MRRIRRRQRPAGIKRVKLNRGGAPSCRTRQQSKPSPPADLLNWCLPCDVHLPVNTTIHKGCLMSTLVDALMVREHRHR
jgi:hypothetical protein